MVKLGPFRQSTNKLQTFLGVADGVDIASTHKNAAGNNIAAYSLTSMIHQMDHMALKLQGKDSSFQKGKRELVCARMTRHKACRFRPCKRWASPDR